MRPFTKPRVQSEYSDTVNKCLSRPILKSKVNKLKKKTIIFEKTKSTAKLTFKMNE